MSPRGDRSFGWAWVLFSILILAGPLLLLTGCERWGWWGSGGGGGEGGGPSTAEEVRIVLGEPTRPEEIGIKIPPGKGVAELQVGPNGSLSFDPDVIWLTRISGVGGFTILAADIDNFIGRAIFAAVAFQEVKEGPIVEVGFVAVGTPGECTELTLSIDKLGDMEGERVPFEVIKGRLCI